jgi:2-amino-4-hydroxy-6-hydroxymethyldihydropteridine diphosphokinase
MNVFIGAGSNIDPEKNILKALKMLSSKMEIKDISTVYRTEAIGGGPDFYNCVIEAETELPFEELKKELQEIEAELGRVREEDKYAPRQIDLDILIYREIAGPEIEERAFIAEGLAELAPEILIRETKIIDIAVGLPKKGMKSLPEYTDRLRKEILEWTLKK